MHSDFTKSIYQETSQKGKKSGFTGKGFKGSWTDELKIPKDPYPPTPVIFLPGSFQDTSVPLNAIPPDPVTGQQAYPTHPFYKYQKHLRKYVKNGKEKYVDFPCSRGNDPYNPQPCAGCLALESGDKSVGKPQSTYALGIYHLVNYHTHPQWDYQKNGFSGRQDGTPYTTKTECIGRDCNFCRLVAGKPIIADPKRPFPPYAPNQITTDFGKRRFLKIGSGHLGNILDMSKIISSACGTCKTKFTVEGYTCPKCETLIIDMENTNLSTEQINQAANSAMFCQNCKSNVFAVEAKYCKSCEQNGRQWTSMDLTDAIVFLNKSGEGTNSKINMAAYTNIEEFENSPDFVNKSMLNGKSLRQIITEAENFEFSEIFKVLSIQDQMTRADLVIPGLSVQNTAPAFQQYSNMGMAPTFHKPNFSK